MVVEGGVALKEKGLRKGKQGDQGEPEEDVKCENKYRQIQVLEILNDQVCNKLIAPYVGRWKEVEGMGENANMSAGFLGK